MFTIANRGAFFYRKCSDTVHNGYNSFSFFRRELWGVLLPDILREKDNKANLSRHHINRFIELDGSIRKNTPFGFYGFQKIIPFS